MAPTPSNHGWRTISPSSGLCNNITVVDEHRITIRRVFPHDRTSLYDTKV